MTRSKQKTSNPITSNKFQVIVLAAGKSTRFGSDKTKISIDHIPISISICKKIQPLIKNILITINENNIQLQQSAEKHKIDYLIIPDNINYGIGSSISQAVLKTSNAKRWMFCLGDMPFIKPETYAKVINNALSQPDNAIVIPTYNKKNGHPISFGQHYYSELIKLNKDTGAKSIIKKNTSLVAHIKTNDKYIHKDIDNENDLKKFAHLLSIDTKN